MCVAQGVNPGDGNLHTSPPAGAVAPAGGLFCLSSQGSRPALHTYRSSGAKNILSRTHVIYCIVAGFSLLTL